ncbi:hypothetical protein CAUPRSCDRAFT_12515 [Caulochytrium protostelioides]|uniref:Uncharacterized protein n=1 Tax=Caulochytrium protostelioides TaxID=1555241 RepID=A0A4P9WTM6_9FUNG|nr:hypothetical protein CAUPRSCDRAFT_12515 [Caulochytrium protostelioides]
MADGDGQRRRVDRVAEAEETQESHGVGMARVQQRVPRARGDPRRRRAARRRRRHERAFVERMPQRMRRGRHRGHRVQQGVELGFLVGAHGGRGVVVAGGGGITVAGGAALGAHGRGRGRRRGAGRRADARRGVGRRGPQGQPQRGRHIGRLPAVLVDVDIVGIGEREHIGGGQAGQVGADHGNAAAPCGGRVSTARRHGSGCSSSSGGGGHGAGV